MAFFFNCVHVPWHFHALEKEMAAHSIVLAWRIPWTGEPGGLPNNFQDTRKHNGGFYIKIDNVRVFPGDPVA